MSHNEDVQKTSTLPSQHPADPENFPSAAQATGESVPTQQEGLSKPLPTIKKWFKRSAPVAGDGEAHLEDDAADDGGDVHAGDVQASPKSRHRRRWVWAAAAMVMLLGGAVFLGSKLPDPKTSEEYQSLQADNARITGDLNKTKTELKTLDDGMKAREARVASYGQELLKREEAVKSAEAAVKKREDAVTVAEKQKAANTVREGTWTVGVDIEPGTYRADAEVSSSCYWGIYRTGSNGSDIIDNDIVSGGRPTVTLSAGQDFKTTRCGAWTKQ